MSAGSQTAMIPTQRGIPALKSTLNSEAIKARFAEVLGKRAPGFLSSVLSAASMNPQLGNADPMSVMQAAMVAATLDLPVNPSLGFAYLVPYRGQAQFQLGYKGFIQLAMRSGQYRLLNATHVFDGELVRNNRFTGEMIFDEDAKTSEEVAGYVAYFRLLNGFEHYKYMTVLELRQHAQKYSQVFRANKGQWIEDFPAMALKTVLKLLLSKWGLLSVELQRAMEVDYGVVTADGAVEHPDNPEGEDASVLEPVAAQSQTEKVKEKLRGRKAKESTPEAVPVEDVEPSAPATDAIPFGLISGEQATAFEAAYKAAGLGDEEWEGIAEAIGAPTVRDMTPSQLEQATRLVEERSRA